MTPVIDAVRQLFMDLRTQKLRTFLTTFGIVWGTVSLSLLLAFGDGLYTQMRRSFAGLGDRIVIAWPSRTSLPFEGINKGRRILVTEEDLDLVRKESRLLLSISPEYSSSFKVDIGKKTILVDISGVEPEFGEMRNLVPQKGGRFINHPDMDERRRVVFIGNDLARDMFGEEDPVGKTVKIFSSPFTVVGVLVKKDQDSSYSGRDKDKAFIPASTFTAVTGAKYPDILIYKAKSPDMNQPLTEEIRGILGKKLHFDPTDKEAIQVWDTTEMFVFLDTFMGAFRLFLGIVGLMTLIVGGIGVSNIMNVVVEERTREIGIKMALGATPRYVLFQFLTEAVIITALGGAIGLAISSGICSLFAKAGLEEFVGVPVVTLRIAILTSSLLGFVGIMAGYFPAKDAASKEPAVAMKF
ncbi:MAG TPA: ABC transporter permease [Acidobacteriota bacterium]|nr:ABC transporter permease [Acidobacteriota bacterium]HNT18452.1 ABC transporter permease [Acidobacteriota bacterium]